MKASLDLYHDASVAVISLADPMHGNALSVDMCAEIVGHLREAEREKCKTVVLTGSGRSFCGGGDLDALRDWSNWDWAMRVDYVKGGVLNVVASIMECRAVVVAAVNGPAVGAGLDIALACDLRMASENAHFEYPYIQLGAIPGGGGGWLLPRVIGLGPAMEVMMTGRRIGAQEALSLGLVTTLHPADRFLERVIGQVLEGVPPLAPTVAHWIRRNVLSAGSETFASHAERTAVVVAGMAGTAEQEDAVERRLQGG